LLSFVACSAPPAASPADAPPVSPDAHAVDTTPADAPGPDLTPLTVHGLGVQGFVLARGNDVVMTAPLFTRQDAFSIALNTPLQSDAAAIDSKLETFNLGTLSAIISGHAHYDHFLDVPHILSHAPNASVYTNLTGRHILAALAPDRDPSCMATTTSPTIDRSRVIAMDDALASYVDYTNCPNQAPPGAPLNGTWLAVPGSHVRVMAFCSMHPAQIAGIYHFGQGSIDTDQCELPPAASGWLEGQTLAFLIDFLDAYGRPSFRVFYQDAPTDGPIGHVPPAILAEKQVDLALLCVGTYDAVRDQPGEIVANLSPRFALSGHWEDFFQPLDTPPQPIPLMNLQTYLDRAAAALPGAPDAPIVVDGAPMSTRHVLVQPGDVFSVPAAP
jgi:hypothetical protein